MTEMRKEEITPTTIYSLKKLALLSDIEKTREKEQYMALYTQSAAIFGKPSTAIDQGLRHSLAQAIADGNAPAGNLVDDELIVTMEDAIIRPYVGGEVKVGMLNIFSGTIVGFTPNIASF